jgi:hypothetical protein
MDTSPTSRPLSITGKCLKRPIVIVSIVEWTVSSSDATFGFFVMWRATGSDTSLRPALGDRGHDIALGNDPDNGAA